MDYYEHPTKIRENWHCPSLGTSDDRINRLAGFTGHQLVHTRTRWRNNCLNRCSVFARSMPRLRGRHGPQNRQLALLKTISATWSCLVKSLRRSFREYHEQDFTCCRRCEGGKGSFTLTLLISRLKSPARSQR